MARDEKSGRKSDRDSRKKPKKEKVVYVDDGSTVVDMTPTDENGKKREKRERSYAPHVPLRDQLRTFTDAQRMMFLPMCAVLGILALAFLILYFLL